VLKYDLATTANLARLPQWEASDFEPHTGVQFHPDGSVTVRALVDNRYSRLTIVGDFNGWGEDETIDLAPYLLQPLPDDPAIHAVTLPPGHYHKMQYRLRDQYGNDRLHLSADVFSTPAFNQRFYDDRNEKHLNSVFWQPTEIEPDQLAPRPDFRGHSVVIAEVDMVTGCSLFSRLAL
jgi:1,4-alpha-glucan branching enzyme